MITSNKQLKRHIIDAMRAAEPATPRCRHADECGGCAVQDRAYEAQVAVKRDALRAMWADVLPAAQVDAIDMVASPSPYQYRTRMDYVATKGRFGLRRSGKFNYIVDLHECHLIPPGAFAIARAVYERAVALGLPDYNLRTHEGWLRYVVVRRSPDDRLLLAIVTGTPDHAEAVEQLAALALAHEEVVGFHWLLNDTLTDLSFGESLQHWGAPTLPMPVGERMLKIGPNTFFQNNIHLLMPLLDDVAQHVGRAGIVADLYGGVGTIALHLAGQAERITCVESVTESTALAAENIRDNGVQNVAVITADTEAFLREQQPGSFDVIVVDPPRTGLGPEVCAQIARMRPQRLVYVSCNPLTQVADAQTLLADYRLARLRGYDMFPHTPHMESLAVFDLDTI
jgi:23S rRNA (uracil-5-)-methyltransferase RumA